jgi:alpha-amylase
MKSINLIFQIHHPFHFQTFRFMDIETGKSYYDEQRIENEITDFATNYYLPTNEFLLKLISNKKNKLKIAFYISGTAIDLFTIYQPEVISSFRKLADTGRVEFLAGTPSHSLITLTNHKSELAKQLKEYQTKIEYFFGKKPSVFVNTDLLYSNLIGKDIEELGYQTIITNGIGKTLHWRSPNYVYSNCLNARQNVLFRNEYISNQLANTFTHIDQQNRKIKTEDFLTVLQSINNEEPLLNLFLDYSLLGGQSIDEKQKFMQSFISHINKEGQRSFNFLSEISEHYGAVAEINAGVPICMVNRFHPDYYPGNELQMEAIKQLYALGKLVDEVDDIQLLTDWNYLQTSDHIHLMDDQHPVYTGNGDSNFMFKTKYDAFINFMNILDDFSIRLKKEARKHERKRHRAAMHNNVDKQNGIATTANNAHLRK